MIRVSHCVILRKDEQEERLRIGRFVLVVGLRGFEPPTFGPQITEICPRRPPGPLAAYLVALAAMPPVGHLLGSRLIWRPTRG
jgi:hypothetical protein